MTLLLENGTVPASLPTKVWDDGGFNGKVGKTRVMIAEYALTNTNLAENDPRLGFIDRVKGLKTKDGFAAECRGNRLNPDERRLVFGK